MKKLLKTILLFCLSVELNASTPRMPPFPKKYESWINHISQEQKEIKADFHNYETSFTEQVMGFNSNNSGSWYGSITSKYIISHRQDFNDSVFFCLQIFNEDQYISKKNLKKVKASVELQYDDISLGLSKLIKVENYHGSKKDGYYAIRVLSQIDKETFYNISKSQSIFIKYKILDQEFYIKLQIPKLYEDTFQNIVQEKLE